MGIVVPVGAVPQGTFGTGRANGLLLNTQRRGHKPTALLFKKKKKIHWGADAVAERVKPPPTTKSQLLHFPCPACSFSLSEC